MSRMSSKKEVIFIGNGPSLADVPMDFLRSRDTIACNRIYMLQDFMPDYHVYQDYRCLCEEREIKRLDAYISVHVKKKSFMNSEFTDKFTCTKKITPIISRRYRFKGWARWYFSYHPEKWIGVLGTVMYTMLQIGYWLGYERGYIVGVDHDFGETNRHFYTDKQANVDVGIFNQEKNDREKSKSDCGYAHARTRWELDGRELINLTPGMSTWMFDRGFLGDYCEPEWFNDLVKDHVADYSEERSEIPLVEYIYEGRDEVPIQPPLDWIKR